MGLTGWISSPRTSQANSGSSFCWAEPGGQRAPIISRNPLHVPAPLGCAVALTGVGHWRGWQKVSVNPGAAAPPNTRAWSGAQGPAVSEAPRAGGSQGKIPGAPLAGQGQCPWLCDVAPSSSEVGVQRGAQTDYLRFVSASALRVAGRGLERGAGGWMWGSGRQMGLRPPPTCSHQAGLGVNPHRALPVLAAFPFWLLPLQ